MEKMNFYYVERFNVVDGKIDGFFVTTAVNLDELLLKLDNDADFAGDTPYLPQVYEITEEQYNDLMDVDKKAVEDSKELAD